MFTFKLDVGKHVCDCKHRVWGSCNRCINRYKLHLISIGMYVNVWQLWGQIWFLNQIFLPVFQIVDGLMKLTVSGNPKGAYICRLSVVFTCFVSPCRTTVSSYERTLIKSSGTHVCFRLWTCLVIFKLPQRNGRCVFSLPTSLT